MRELLSHVDIGETSIGVVTDAGVTILRSRGKAQFFWKDYTDLRRLLGFVVLYDRNKYDKAAYISNTLLPPEVQDGIRAALRAFR